MFIVDYHYILKENGPYDLHGPSRAQFADHLDVLQKQNKMVDVKEMVALAGREKQSEDYCALVFDDGPVDQYEILPELLQRNIVGTFCPIACVFEGIVPLTIKMHIVFSKVESESIATHLESYILEHFSREYPSFSISRTERISQLKGRYDDPLTANIKYLLATLPVEIKQSFVDEAFQKIIQDEKAFCREFFIQPHQLKEMHDAGMIIGAHGHQHTSLMAMDYAAQKKDIEKSKGLIEEIIDAPVDVFSYPFGHCNEQTVQIVKDVGFTAGVLFNHRAIQEKDDAFSLSMYDWKDLDYLT